jgi:thymidine kinase
MNPQPGQIEMICGSMFCGKTEELIRRVRRALIARQTVQVFKPSIDMRYGVESVTSHTGQTIVAQPIPAARDILSLMDPATTVVAIDEAQFFDPAIVDVVRELVQRGLRVIIAGLDMDFRGEPFGPMPELLARADDVTKLHAICVVCGERAYLTQRLIDGQPAHFDDPVVLIGASERYEARCRLHHQVRFS